MNYRIQELDTIRTLGIFSVVLSHLRFYTNSELLNNSLVYHFFIDFGVISFFFLSGFLATLDDIKDRKGCIRFFQKKIGRIFPLYWLALLTMYIVIETLKINQVPIPSDFSILSIFIHLLGLQILIPYSFMDSNTFYIPTTWFISAVLIYYLYYLIISYCSKNLKDILIGASLLILPFIVIKYWTGLVDTRFFHYYSSFILGIFEGHRFRARDKFLSKSLIFLVVAYLTLYAITQILGVNPYGIINIKSFIYYIFISRIILCGNNRTPSNSVLRNETYFQKLIKKISYSSFAIYLFHIQLLSISKNLLDLLNLDEITRTTIIFTIILPLIYIISLNIQVKYDLCTKCVKAKKYSPTG